ncbi:MAG: hypothetical protein OHK0039_44480 [Bacteroidia bacterium]
MPRCRYTRLPVVLLLLLGHAASAQAQVANRSGVDSTIFISHTVFLPDYIYSSGEQNWAIVAADLDGDGYPDAVSVSKPDGLVNVHLNDGKGNLMKRHSFAAGRDNRALCVFDADGDPAPDLAVVSLNGDLYVLHNQGRGTFQRSDLLHCGRYAHDVTAGDLDGDGHSDLLVSLTHNNHLHWYRNDGKGRFAPGGEIRTGHGPRIARIGELDGDGLPDLVAGADGGRLYLHRNLGQGRFAPPQPLRSTLATWGLALADLDGNGSLDIVAASYLDKMICVHLNQGDGTFGREQEISSGDHNFGVVVADFDLDGDPDIATCSSVDHALNFHLNDGNGVFGPRNMLKSGDWNVGIAAADFDRDGDPDVVLAAVNDRSIHLHRNISADKRPQPTRQACLRGKVYDAETGAPVAAALVTLAKPGAESVAADKTRDTGSFEICPPMGRTYVLSVRAAGWPVHRDTVFMPDTDIEHDVYLHRQRSCFVYGCVYDRRTLRPLPDAQVVIQSSRGDTLAVLQAGLKGDYRQVLLPDTGYVVSAAYAGYEAGAATFALQPAHEQGLRVDVPLQTGADPNSRCLDLLVLDETTRAVVPYAAVLVRDLGTGRRYKFRVGEDGRHRLCIPQGSYEISSRAKGYFFYAAQTVLEPGEAAEAIPYEILLRPLAKDASIVLRFIYFDVDKSTLRPESVEELERLTEIIRDNPGLVIAIEGHTDSDASDDYNEVLSQSRADAVVAYLLAAGIPAHRMQARGYGERRPVAPNDSPANKQLNRRTEFRILSMDAAVR